MRMPVCPRGHETLWPRSCPVCLASRVPYQGRDTVEHRVPEWRGSLAARKASREMRQEAGK